MVCPARQMIFDVIGDLAVNQRYRRAIELNALSP
jgi:hypothetical protein